MQFFLYLREICHRLIILNKATRLTNQCNHTPIPQEHIQSKIDEYGCLIIKVDANDYLPGFAYTIGLYQRYKHPEVICFGLNADLMHDLLNDACEMIKTGHTLQSGQEYAQFLESYMVRFLEVDKSYYSNYLNYCSWFYQNQEYPALQQVWPDGKHMFPWDSQYNPELKFKQPLLDRNTDFKFYEEKTLGVFTTKQGFRR